LNNLKHHSEPLHFKFTTDLDSEPVFWIKMQMNEEWDGQKGSSAIEIERPFQLLTRDFPIELDESKVPATIPKTKPPEEYKGYQDALEKCAMRKEMNDHAINQCRQDLNDIRNTKPLRFSDCGWPNFKSVTEAPDSEDLILGMKQIQ